MDSRPEKTTPIDQTHSSKHQAYRESPFFWTFLFPGINLCSGWSIIRNFRHDFRNSKQISTFLHVLDDPNVSEHFKGCIWLPGIEIFEFHRANLHFFSGFTQSRLSYKFGEHLLRSVDWFKLQRVTKYSSKERPAHESTKVRPAPSSARKRVLDCRISWEINASKSQYFHASGSYGNFCFRNLSESMVDLKSPNRDRNAD